MTKNQSTWMFPIAGCVLLLVAGCGDEDQIRTYPVPDASFPTAERPTVTATYDARMLAAMMPQGEKTWFFKLLGPDEAVAELETAFRDFLQTVRFADGKPTWTIPEGWRQQPGTVIRFATLQIGEGERPLELTVIPLETPSDTVGGGGEQYVLENVNRWRGQLGLSEISAGQLPDETERIEIDDVTATFVTVVGQAPTTDPMGRAPFASGLTSPHGSSGTIDVPDGSTGNSSSPITYTTPKGWKPGKQSTMRKASLEVADGDNKAEITVFQFQPSPLLANVNRWRGQIGMSETTQKQLEKDRRTIQIDGAAGDYVELAGSEQTILAVMLNRAGSAWFFKIQGDGKLVGREKERFEEFVKSVKFK